MITILISIYITLSIPILGSLIFFFIRDHKKIQKMSINSSNLSKHFEKELRERTSQINQINQDLYKTNVLLTQAKEKSMAIIKYLGDGIIVTDNDGIILESNSLARELFNCPEKSIIDQPIKNIFDNEQYLNALKESKSNPDQTIETEVFIKEPNKKDLNIKITRAIDKKGNPIGFISLIRDVSKQKELDHLKNFFIRTISHELNTPLTSSIGFIDILKSQKRGPLNEEQLNFLDVILESSLHLKQLISDLLDVVFIDSGRIDIKLQQTDLYEVCREITNNYTKQANSKGISINLPKKNGLPNINTDSDKIKKVYGNILNNAIKFTNKGSIEISFDHNDESVITRVTDTGIGISADKKDIIFDRFRQIDTSSTRQYEGMGIGLSIAKDILNHLGGKIEVASELGKGSTFSFSLPLTNKSEG